MRRQLYTGGGIASLQRQGYGLGDIVKKAGKVVKQVFKNGMCIKRTESKKEKNNKF